ncbi:MAG: TVP38/TMEM64 family protein [Phycisphaerales bacterium]
MIGKEAPSQEPLPEGWPVRPALSLLLAALLLVVSLVVVLGSRNESVLGWRFGAAMGLSEKKPRPLPPPYSGLASFPKVTAGGALCEVVDAAPGTPAEMKAAIERVTGTTAPAAMVVVTPVSLVRSGRWAPTRQEARVEVRFEAVPGATELTAEQRTLAAAAVAERMESLRRVYRPFADALADGEATSTRRLTRGYASNIATLALLGLLLYSLAPGATRLTAQWDRAHVIYEKVGPVAILGLAWTSMPAVLGILLLTNIGPISDLLHTNKLLGWFGFVAVFVISAGVGFLPTYGQSILGGWVFGFAWGFPGSMLGFVGGSLIGYVIAQRVSRHKVEDLLNSNARSRAVRDALIGHGFWRTLGIVTLIRVPPNSPFALTNLVMASAGVKLLPYALGTLIGMAPRTGIAVAFAAAGRATGARDIQEFIEEQPWWVVPAGLVVFMVVLGVIGLIANKALHQVAAVKVDAAGK